jgi:hypothetical protein
VRVGVIGYSEGNGHPFSFSSIINGFDQHFFHLNPIKPINDYLIEQPQTSFGVDNWRVTHVWCPDNNMSEAIAKYAKIDHPVSDFKQMVDQVDVVLILRDDLHIEIAGLFLNAGKYVFIDKPLSLNTNDLRFFQPFLESGQLMSCSGLRYLPQIQKLKSEILAKDLNLKFAYCTTADNWENYGIHSLEGLSPIFGYDFSYVQYVSSFSENTFIVKYKSGKSLLINCSKGHSGGIRSHIYSSSEAPIEVHYNDNFNAFRNTLINFNLQIESGNPSITPKETIALMKVLIAGKQSKLTEGAKIQINEE